MRRILIGLIALAAGGIAVAGPGTADAKNRKPVVLIPYEIERAAERGDKAMISLNDDVTRMPSFRVLELPIVDGRLGEHARLDDVEIYFPFGSIVAATTELHKYRPALVASGSVNPEFMHDPRYARVRSFDTALGPVCASEPGLDGNTVEMRISRNKMFSVVHTMPAKFRGPTAIENPSYKVTSALEIRFLSIKEPAAEHLYRQCQRPKATTLTQKN